jgi:hypothetical protein
VSSLLRVNINFTHNLLNVLVKIANRMGLKTNVFVANEYSLPSRYLATGALLVALILISVVT